MSTLRTGLLFIVGTASATGCTAILGGFDFEGDPVGGSGGTASSSSSSGAAGGTTSSSSSGTTCTSACTTPADCNGPAPECYEHACEAGCCTLTPSADGTVAATGSQTAKDCAQVVCDGKGSTKSIADGADRPDDSDACHDGTCDSAGPLQVAIAGSCAFNGGAVCGDPQGSKAGQCVECNAETDCAAQATSCKINGCNASKCAWTPAAAGADCTDNGKVCDGAGTCVGCLNNTHCTAPQVCDPGGKKCVPAGCTNTVKDSAETDVDCGGPVCAACAPGKACLVQTDCTPGYCNAGVCKAPSCTDEVQDGNETDVDCGGTCTTKCADGKHCAAGADCASTVCAAGLCVSCSDGAKNGSETDVDCGGSCTTKCADGKACVNGADCTNNACSGGLCISCADAKKNGSETDVDCGGSCTTKCADGKACVNGADCQNANCIGGVCVSCTDGIKNGSETDVDCGGSCSQKCAFALACAADGDCATGFCIANKCDALTLSAGFGSTFGNIAIDSANVYWMKNGATGAVYKVPKAGGATIALASDQPYPYDIVTSNGVVYWSNQGGVVMKVPAGGGAATAVDSTAYSPNHLAVGGGNLFWSDGNKDLYKIPVGGGSRVKLATGASQIATDLSTVFWTSNTIPGVVASVPIGGGTPLTLASGQDEPYSIAVDAAMDRVYWTNVHGTYALMSIPRSGGSPTVLATPTGGVKCVTFSTTHIYYSAGSSIIRIAKSGGSPTIIASEQAPQEPQELEVDASYIYWVNLDGTVKKAQK